MPVANLEYGLTFGGLDRETVESLGSPLARVVELHDEVASTQEVARGLARRGRERAPHGTLVVGGVQTGGRGRLGRAWGSPRGGLWMSIVLRPEIRAEEASRVTPSAAVGVGKALWELGVEARIKWPNDLLVEPGGRKVCGILAESSIENVPVASKRAVSGDLGDRRLDFVVLGIGLNANLDPGDLGLPEHEAASLRSELGRDVEPLELLGPLLSRLDAELRRLTDFEAVLDDWRALNCTLGRPVKVQRFGETLEGRAVDLSPEGGLVLALPGGERVELYEGEVEHLRREP
ncbi:MAG: biotin--[acetyl-CoA-carboxylase] ligase [Rubrobacter sp.]|nr:biotin--[acetyl-CoA-carboxylase] ligase [Rubrobacter sp.]